MRSRPDRLIALAERRVSLGIEHGMLHRRLEDEMLNGSTFTLDGRTLVDFSTCPYPPAYGYSRPQHRLRRPGTGGDIAGLRSK